MKTINVTFEDQTFEELKNKKGRRSWRQYIIDLTIGVKNNLEFRKALEISEKGDLIIFDERKQERFMFGDSKAYKLVLEHRKNCSKWRNEFCLDCFGGGLTNFIERLEEERR